MSTIRRIGPVGTASRVLGGLGLLVLAFADEGSWGLDWYDAALGLLVFPAVMVAVGLAARRYKGRSVRFTGPVGLALNLAVLAGLFLNNYTATAAALFYGATLLVAAWRAQPGCEATVLSNWILRRDDQIGCPTLTPIDAVEARLAARNSRFGAPSRSAGSETTTEKSATK